MASSMSSARQTIVTQASEYWQQGKPLEAGRVIFESLPNACRPKWAANVLRSVLTRSGIYSQPIGHVLAIAANPNEWNKAHDAFQAVRRATLDLEQSRIRDSKGSLLLSHLLLAELVAKVTYNSTNPTDEFDEDSGWWIAVNVRDIINLINDENFSRSIWSVICSEDY